MSGTYGQRRPGEPGTPIDQGDGQTAEKVNFVLSRGSVIAGRIVDDGGEPVSGTMVSAMRFAFVSGTRRLVPGGTEGGQDRTDDQGNFRLFGLPPGDYYISANNRTAIVAGDGAFQFANVAPGRYIMNVRPSGMPGSRRRPPIFRGWSWTIATSRCSTRPS